MNRLYVDETRITHHKVSQLTIKCHNFLNFVLRIFPVQKGFLGIQGAHSARTEYLFPSISLFLCKTQAGACTVLENDFLTDPSDSTIFRCPCCPRSGEALGLQGMRVHPSSCENGLFLAPCQFRVCPPHILSAACSIAAREVSPSSPCPHRRRRGNPLRLDPRARPLVFSSHKLQILRSVNRVFRKRLSFQWLRRFLQRKRSLLRHRLARPIQTSRLRAWNPASVRNWIRRHQDFMATHSFPSHAGFNMDETRLVPKSHRRVVVSASGHKANERLSRVKCLATLVPVVAANGSVLVSFLILKASKTGMVRGFRKLKEFRTRPAWPHYVVATRSGYTNRRLWRQMLDRVKKVWHQHHPGLNCLIYMGNCSPHRSGDDSTLEDDFILRLSRQNIHCCFLPPNTTAWLQPLDDVPFGQLKLVLGRKHSG